MRSGKRAGPTVGAALAAALFVAGCGKQDVLPEEETGEVGMAEQGRDVKVATGYSEKSDPLAAAREATQMAVSGLSGSPLKGVIFYENYKGHDAETNIGATVADAAQGVATIGVRAIPHTDAGALWEHSIGVLAIGGEDAQVKTTAIALVDEREEMGRELGRTMSRLPDLRLIVALAEMNLSFAPENVSVEKFLHGIKDVAGPQVAVFGGNGEVTSWPDNKHSLQFLNGEALEGHVVAMGIGGPVRLIGANGNEFSKAGDKVTVTRARGKWVMAFDGQPAAQLYRDRKGYPAEQPLTYDDTDPIGVDVGDGQVYIRMILFEKKEDYTEEERKQEGYIQESEDLPAGSLRFVAEVPEGTAAWVMTYNASAQDILTSAAETVKRSLSLKKAGEEPLVLLTSSCCARRTRLRNLDDTADEVRQGIQPAMGEKTFPVFGLDAWGELGPLNSPYKGLACQYQQHTFVSGLLVLEE